MASIKRYKKAKGTAWRVQYRAPDGSSRTKQGFRTKDEAQAWAERNATDTRTGEWVAPEDKRRTVDELAPMWLARLERRTEGTRRVYLPCWEQHVQPVWGAQAVGAIRPSAVQAWVDGQTLGAVMVRRMANILAQVLEPAVKDGTLKANPARGLDLPAKPKPRQVYLTAVQLSALAAEAKHPEIVWVLGTVGLRWGELAGLRVRNVNVLRSRLTVEEAATTNGAVVTVGDTKTHERREVAVPRFVMDMLVPLMDGKGPDDWVWTSSSGGPMRRPTADVGWFAGAVDRCMAADPAFPRVTPHGLRHVAAGLMVSSGANPKVVQRQLGHASAAMTLDVYASLFENDIDQVAQKMEDAVKQAKSKFYLS
ncbi:site-specific integrase [Corynebacterium qintianiae]|uniref:site-specific integrase n=1 Tax=Corynebacterium qintianiae TaxID=2709392 RepID=UPI0013ED810F|nr:site-specific integrase [Corynebacterium qintianiae]